MFVFLLPGFGLPFNFLWAVFVMSVTNLGILLPSTPGFIGTFHFFCITALVALGVATETATVYAVGAHLSFFIPITIWGLGALGFYVGNWGAMIAAAIGARKLPSLSEALRLEASDTVKTIPSEAIDPPSRFLVALVEALVPFEEAPGILENDQRIVKEVASFVHGQIQTLPKKLLGLFSLGMLFFRAWVRIRHFHGFCLLPLQLRQGIVNNWAFGRVALLRQLFRPVHSLVILGFFENEEVKALLK